jgi:Tfp pilus assembly protein PilV
VFPIVRRVHRDERGVGLVESLVATALLGIALVAMMGTYSTLAIASRRAEQTALAQAAARAQVARIKAAPYQADGDYSAYYEGLAAGQSRSLTVTWWDGTSAWVGTQNANGLQRLQLVINSDGSPAATIDFVKANR